MSRKYKQRGYQEDSEPRPADRPRGERERSTDGPRGRGLGAPTERVVKCSRCGTGVETAIEPSSSCPQCGSALHSCTNCRHFDSSAVNECREDIPRRINAKAERNDCGSFAAKVVMGFSSGSEAEPDDAKAAFDALFDL